jgi:hypothetical protein
MEEAAPNTEVNVSGRARRQRGWWKRGVVKTKLNMVNTTAWVHTECDIMDEDALLRLQGAWENSERKDECTVRMNDFELDYWMGTLVGQLRGYGFQGATFGVDGSSKDRKKGSGCGKIQGEEVKRQTNVHESAERRKARIQTGQSWGQLCSRYSQQLLA